MSPLEPDSAFWQWITVAILTASVWLIVTCAFGIARAILHGDRNEREPEILDDEAADVVIRVVRRQPMDALKASGTNNGGGQSDAVRRAQLDLASRIGGSRR